MGAPLRAEYVHTVAHDDNEADEVRELANKTWHAMKRTTKAGQRRSVSGWGPAALALLGPAALGLHTPPPTWFHYMPSRGLLAGAALPACLLLGLLPAAPTVCSLAALPRLLASAAAGADRD